MEIDSTPVPPPQEYSDFALSHQQQHYQQQSNLHQSQLPQHQDTQYEPAVGYSVLEPYTTESSMNFDYLNTLHDNSEGGAGSSNSSMHAMEASSSFSNANRPFAGLSAASSSILIQGHVDDSRTLDRPYNLNERFVTVLDQLDARVEKFRKDALGLQEKRDFLLMSIDLIKSNEMLQNMSESEREEITCYIQRVNSRLSTVELNVRTVRDNSQEDSLSQINALIDMMITMGDPVMSRQRCQQYLNACCSLAETGAGTTTGHMYSVNEDGGAGIDMDAGPIDKKFESVLLGCTLDDQKNIKKRLQALMGYLNKQTIRS